MKLTGFARILLLAAGILAMPTATGAVLAVSSNHPNLAAVRDAAVTASDAFARWTVLNRNQPISATALSAGVRLAQDRASAMRQLLEADPEDFVRRALPESERAALPALVQPHVERRLQTRGFYGVYCALPYEHGDLTHPAARHGSGFRRIVRAEGVTYQAHVFGKWQDQTTVQDADVSGIVLGDAIALGDNATPDEQAAAGAPVIATAPTTSGANTVLYLIARFSDQTSDPVTTSAALSQMVAVSNFWMNNSYGTVSTHGLANPNQPADVVLITLPHSSDYASTYNANFSELLADARAAALDQGYRYGDYNLDVVVTTSSGFDYAGVAWVGAQGAHLVAGYTSLRTAGHELGHNLGLWHANYWRTDATAPFGKDTIAGGYCADTSNAEWVEYGHYFSIMSAQTGEMDDAAKPHYAAAEKAKLGWLSGSRVQYANSSGTYRLFRQDHPQTTNTPRAIRIETTATDYTGNSRRYWLNYRYAPWSVAQDWCRNGLQVDVCKTSYGEDGAIMLDMTPFSKDESARYFDPANKPSGWWTIDNDDKRDGALVIGRTHSDKTAGIHITPVGSGNNGVNQEYLDVVINLGTFPSNAAPRISTFTASANQVVTGQNVTFRVDATDPDGDPIAYAWDFDQSQVWTASGLNTNTATKSWTSAGQYRVTVTVSDMKGGVASDSIIVTVGTPANSRRIYGRVLWGGLPVAGTRVYTSTGGVTYQAFTESDGSYALTDLPPSSTLTLNCRADGLSFTAQFQNPVAVADGNAYGMDFFANEAVASPGGESRFTLSGKVTDNGVTVAGAEIFAGGLIAITDASGNYTLSNLVNGTYTVIARRLNWTFSPGSRDVTINSANSTGNNFARQTCSITGRFYGVSAATGTTAPRVYLSNGRYAVATKAGTGSSRYWYYSLASVPAGTFSLTAELSGSSLVSTNFINPLIVNGSISGLDFTGISAPASAAISGRITRLGLPLSGVVVEAGVGDMAVALATTDSDGCYRLSQVTNTSYTIRPTLAGHTFSPVSLVVASVPATNRDFTASATNPPPVIATVSATPNPVLAGDAASVLSVTASGRAPLSYSWGALTAPSPVTFSTNHGPGAASTTASLQDAGSYTFRVKVTDADGFSATSNLSVMVSTSASQLAVRPYEIEVTNGQQVSFTATAWSRQGVKLSAAPLWFATGGGSIDTNGLFVATSSGGPFCIVATAGSLNATGSVWVVGEPAPVSVWVEPLADASEWEATPGAFTVFRTGETNLLLAVFFTLAGTATSGDDYTSTANPVVIPAGASHTVVEIAPWPDSTAEGDETVAITLIPDTAYVLTNTSVAALLIHDSPVDQWRFTRFSPAELEDPAISGDDADPDHDGIVNLLEYAFALTPKTADTNGLPFASLEGGRLTLSFRQNKDALDLTLIPEVADSVMAGSWTEGGLDEISRRDLGHWWEITVQDSAFTTNAPMRFMRLKVLHP